MIRDPVVFQLIYGILIGLMINVLYVVNFVKNDNLRWSVSTVFAVAAAILVGIRGTEVGLDSANYNRLFQGEITEGINEPVLYGIALLLRTFTNETAVFFSTVALSTNLLFLAAFRRLGRDYPLYFAIYASFFIFINQHINIIRQGLAMAFFAYAASLLLTHRQRAFWVPALLAFLTHASAIFVFPLYFIYRLRRHKWLPVLIGVMMVVLASVTLADLIRPIQHLHWALDKVYWYLTWGRASPWHLKHYYYLVLLLLIGSWLLIVMRKRLSENHEAYYVALLFYSFGFMLVVLFRSEEMFADRIFYYFLFLVPVMVAGLVTHIKPSVVAYALLLVAINAWYFKSAYLQYDGWFVPPFESIRVN